MSTPLSRSGMRAARRARVLRRADLAQRLLDAIQRLTDDGTPFSELSVERLATEAGISRSSFYRYFGDKSEVLLALAEEMIAERNAAGVAIWEVPSTAPRSVVHTAFRHFLRVCWKHRAVMRAVADAQGYDPAAKELHSDVFRNAVNVVTEHILTGQAEGWIRAELHPRLTAEWLAAMNERGLAALVGRATEDELDSLADALTSIVWYTLYDGVRDPDGDSAAQPVM